MRGFAAFPGFRSAQLWRSNRKDKLTALGPASRQEVAHTYGLPLKGLEHVPRCAARNRWNATSHVSAKSMCLAVRHVIDGMHHLMECEEHVPRCTARNRWNAPSHVSAKSMCLAVRHVIDGMHHLMECEEHVPRCTARNRWNAPSHVSAKGLCLAARCI